MTAACLCAGALGGCRTAAHQTADHMLPETRTGASPATTERDFRPAPGSFEEPPSAFARPPVARGPSEPVPLLPSEDSLDLPQPIDESAEGDLDDGPVFQTVPAGGSVKNRDRAPTASIRRSSLDSLKAKFGLRSPGKTTAAEQVPVGAKERPRSKPQPTFQAGDKVAQRTATAPTEAARTASKPVDLESEQVVRVSADGKNAARTKRAASASRPSPTIVAEPPRLVAPPTSASFAASSAASLELSILRIAVCDAVYDYNDFSELDAARLTPGQPILVYAALDNFRSHAAKSGFRTLTRSTLEIRRPGGELIQQQFLGAATDVSSEPRHEYFLTHEYHLPADLPAGEYVIHLRIEDLLAERWTEAQLNVVVRAQ